MGPFDSCSFADIGRRHLEFVGSCTPWPAERRHHLWHCLGGKFGWCLYLSSFLLHTAVSNVFGDLHTSDDRSRATIETAERVNAEEFG